MNSKYYFYEKPSDIEVKENEITAQLRHSDALEILLDNSYNNELFVGLIKNFAALEKDEQREFLGELSNDVEKINKVYKKFLTSIQY